MCKHKWVYCKIWLWLCVHLCDSTPLFFRRVTIHGRTWNHATLNTHFMWICYNSFETIKVYVFNAQQQYNCSCVWYFLFDIQNSRPMLTMPCKIVKRVVYTVVQEQVLLWKFRNYRPTDTLHRFVCSLQYASRNICIVLSRVQNFDLLDLVCSKLQKFVKIKSNNVDGSLSRIL